MRFHLGTLPDVPDFDPDASWRLVPDPPFRSMQIRALPIGIVSFMVLFGLWLVFTPMWQILRTIHFPLPVPLFILCFTGVLIVHELLHVSFHPGAGFTRRSVIGFWPSRMFLYALYAGELSRRRCIAILLVPFITISIVPVIAAVLTQKAFFWIAYMSVLNAFLSCGDMLAVWYTMTLIPAGAIIRSKQWSTYIREKSKPDNESGIS
jgi:hypothetical protein